MKTTLEIIIPVSFMNAAVTVDNHFIADTNNSVDWKQIKFPLPSGNWIVQSTKINSYPDNNYVITLKHKCPHNSSTSWGRLATCSDCGYEWIKDYE